MIGTAKQRLADYFAANPDEELTYLDLTAKLDIPIKTANRVVAELKTEGVLESVHVIRLRVRGIAA